MTRMDRLALRNPMRASPKRRLLIVVALSISAAVASPACATTHAQTDVVVDDLLTQMQAVLMDVEESRITYPQLNLPQLTKATLYLKSTIIKETDGKISVVVVQLGREVSEHSILELRLDLAPPRDSDPSEVSNDVQQSLSRAIIEAATAVARAEAGVPPLRLQKLTATIRFVVGADAGGGLEISVLPVDLTFGTAIETEAVHQLTLEFARQ